MAGANVLPILDTSNSMTVYGYVQPTKTDSQAFVRSARPGDRIGVVSYDQNGRITYPLVGNQLVTVDFSLKQTREAADAIEKLTFYGNCTNIGGGILTARTMMDSAPYPKGLVLLSDGYQNCGTEPLGVLPSYPIYSCAMGPYSDQTLMRTIASRTGGSYYFAPTVFDMMLIFNQIRGELDLTMRIVTNELNTLTKGESASYRIPISEAQIAAEFPYVWNDVNVTYTSDPPSGNQIRIRLIDPNGVDWIEPPQVIDRGYVIWNVENPAAGTWKIEVELGATLANEIIPVTAAGYEYSVEEAISLHIDDPRALQNLGSATSHVSLIENGKRIGDAGVTVEKLTPSEAIRSLLVTPEMDANAPDASPLTMEDSSSTYRVVAIGTASTGRIVQRTRIITLFAGE